MFRSTQFVTSVYLLGTHRSLLMTVKDSLKPSFGSTICSSPLIRQFCSASKKKGHWWRQHCKREPWNLHFISRGILHKPFSCLVNTSCFIKPSDSSHNGTYCLRNAYKLYSSSTISLSIFTDSVPNMCLIPGNKIKHVITHTNTSIESQKCYHTLMETMTFESTFSPQCELSKRTSDRAWWSCCGRRTSQTCGLHKRVPHQVTLEQCLSTENESRCRGHLQPNTALYEKEGGKSWAAVLVSLCTVGGNPSFLFTLRSSKLRGRHKGDVSFAGGKRDPSDRNVVDTALREAWEELGITVTENEIWGVLKPLRDASGMMIAPVLANIGPLESLTFRPNPTEVEEIFTLTVSHVCNPHNRGYTHFRTGDRYGYTLPVFHNSKYRIWGLTAIALDHTLKLIMPAY